MTDGECPVCTLRFGNPGSNEVKTSVTCPSCNNRFCIPCMWKWAVAQMIAKKSATCPMCRESLLGICRIIGAPFRMGNVVFSSQEPSVHPTTRPSLWKRFLRRLLLSINE